MKNSKRILSVQIKRIVDDSPDTSWLGKYSNRPETEYAIDRKHSLECPVNTHTETPTWVSTGSGRIELQMTLEQAQSVSHSGECDEDVKALSEVPDIKKQLEALDKEVLASELKEYGAWDETERADHAQNLQRILWLLGNDLAENNGYDCGECSDMCSREFRYFNGPVENYKGETPEDIRKYVLQDYARMESLNRGDWCFIGIRADAEISLPCEPHKIIGTSGERFIRSETVQTIMSGGLWGIESDSDAPYLESIEQEQLSELKQQLRALGFGTRAISAAFRNVLRKDE